MKKNSKWMPMFKGTPLRFGEGQGVRFLPCWERTEFRWS